MGHSHHDHAHHAPKTFSSLFLIAIIANAAFVIIEASYAYFAHSTSLLADAGHNLGDVLGLIFAALASQLLTKRPSHRYSYGFKRTTIIAALINAVVLFATTAVIIAETLHKFFHPTAIATTPVMIVALIGIAVNGGSALLFMRNAHEDLNIKGAFLHLAYDALISLGVVLVALCIAFTHWEILDPIAGLLIAIAIVVGAWGLFRDSLSLILDGVPRQVDLLELKQYLESIDGVTGVHDLHVWGLSTQENALTVHLTLPQRQFTDADRRAIEAHLKTEFRIHHVTIQIEQDDCEHDCGTETHDDHHEHDHEHGCNH